MANEFKIKKGLIVTGASGGTVVDIQGSQGQLFSVTDDLSGSIFAVSDISGVPILDVNSSGAVNIDGTLIGSSTAYFSGAITTNLSSEGTYFTGGSGGIRQLSITSGTNTSAHALHTFNIASSNGKYEFDVNGTTELSLVSSNATFTGDVISNGNIKINTGSHLFFDGGTNATYISEDVADRLRFFVGGAEFMRFTESTADTVSIFKDTTFSTQAFATTATSSGDASSTLTTKGYVDSLITGATIYRGAWDPSGGGYGSPDLSGVTQTSGYYYICSADGTAEPNGTGTEPDTWAVGDWVIYNDVSGTGQWQKIDNSSVLSGVGTGQTVALWEGASSVTDSETLGNAPITVSGNNTFFTGDINVLGEDINFATGGFADINNSGTGAIRLRPSGTTTALTLNATTSTFAGDLTVSGGDITLGGTGRIQGVDTVSATTDAANKAYVDAHGGGLGPFLPLTAGSSYPLTGELFLESDLTIDNATGDPYIKFKTTAQEYVVRIDQSDSEKFQIRDTTNSLTRVTLDSTGNVGIGTTSPGAKLDVNGGGRFNTDTGSTPFYITRNGANDQALKIYVDDAAAVFESIQDETADGYGSFIFNMDAGVTEPFYDIRKNNSTIMRVDGNGKVGIGNTLPDFRLHTNLDLSGSPLAYLNGTSNTFDATANLGVTHNSTAVGTGTAAGVYLANNANDDEAPSPIVAFSALSASGTYNHTYAAIYGIKTAGGADTNWVKGDLTFATGNTTGPERRMTIDSTGNVGIGTTSPGEPLTVKTKTDAYFPGIKVEDYNSSMGLYVQNIEGQNSGIGTGRYYNSGSWRSDVTAPTTIRLDGGAIRFYAQSGVTADVNYTPTQRMNIAATGAIKFNAYNSTNQTGTPTYLLGTDASGNVVKTNTVPGSAAGPYLPLAGGTVTGATTIQGRLSVGTSTSSDIDMLRAGPNYITATNAAGVLYFRTVSDIRMAITAGGNVGVGLTNPGAKLDVDGVIKNNSYINTGGQAGAMLLGRGGAMSAAYLANDFLMFNTGGDCLILGTGGVGMIVKATTGNVGIGTTTPLAKLDIQGTQGQLFSVTDDLSGSIFAVSDISGVPIFDVNSSGVSYFDGNVGIGTTPSPSTKLEVNGQTIINSTNVAMGLAWFNNQNELFSFQDGGGAGELLLSDSGVKVAIKASGNSYFNGGNVGIGTTSPSRALDVVGVIQAQGFFKSLVSSSSTNLATSNGGSLNLTNSSATDGNFSNIGGYNSNSLVTSQINFINVSHASRTGDISFNTHNGTGLIERMRIDNAGNVGIGTTSPTSALGSTKVLDISSTGNGEVILDHTDAGTGSDLGLYSWARSNDHLAHIKAACEGATDAAFISFHAQPSGGSFTNAASNEKMRISSSGNVTIQGTTTATNFILSSDERLKENIKKACDNRIKANWKTFELKTDKGQKRYGVIAQELEKTNPEFVREDTQGFKSVAYIDLLIAKIAELEARLEKAGI